MNYEFYKKIKYNLKYIFSKLYITLFKVNANVMSIEETIEAINEKKSIIRFGDGEFSILSGKNILFEKSSRELKNALLECLTDYDNEKILLCLPETLKTFAPFKKSVVKNWTINFYDNYKYYKKYCSPDYIYGNAFVSRPYMAYNSKKHSEICFRKLMELFDDKDIYVIEGELSRTGVANDLFKKALSVHRIVCPSQNAFSKLNEIENAALEAIPKNALVLVALGPTSKPLVEFLSSNGYWALDIGHIDSEYEWFLEGTNQKTRNSKKHMAEQPDDDISICDDQDYIKSIVNNLVN